jgi:putative transposase
MVNRTMPRKRRFTEGGYVYHACNRGSRKGELFESYEDYDAYLQLAEVARRKFAMRVIAYCLMVNHLHFLLWPRDSTSLVRFMHWLTSKHASRFHRVRGSVGTGAVYQSRYFSRPISEDRRFFTALRYVEQNAFVAGLVDRAEDWRWGSAWNGSPPSSFVLDESPLPRPSNWLEVLNDPLTVLKK